MLASNLVINSAKCAILDKNRHESIQSSNKGSILLVFLYHNRVAKFLEIFSIQHLQIHQESKNSHNKSKQ